MQNPTGTNACRCLNFLLREHRTSFLCRMSRDETHHGPVACSIEDERRQTNDNNPTTSLAQYIWLLLVLLLLIGKKHHTYFTRYILNLHNILSKQCRRPYTHHITKAQHRYGPLSSDWRATSCLRSFHCVWSTACYWHW